MSRDFVLLLKHCINFIIISSFSTSRKPKTCKSEQKTLVIAKHETIMNLIKIFLNMKIIGIFNKVIIIIFTDK